MTRVLLPAGVLYVTVADPRLAGERERDLVAVEPGSSPGAWREEALQERVDQLIEKDRELQEMSKIVAAYEGSSVFRIARGIRSVLRRAVPGASRRHRPFKGDARGPEGERDPESDAAPK
jgi:hypothetical protein